LEEAEDFAPIIEGIEETLNEWGYNSIVIPYERTKDSFFGKIAGARDFLNSFKSSSEVLAEKECIVEVNFLTGGKSYPPLTMKTMIINSGISEQEWRNWICK